MAEFVDRVLRCADCGQDFVFSAREQQFYFEKNFRNEPRRCKSCKSKRVEGRDRGRQGSRKVETMATCSQCGRQTTLPFKPTQGRPVYCRECFQQRRAAAAGGAP